MSEEYNLKLRDLKEGKDYRSNYGNQKMIKVGDTLFREYAPACAEEQFKEIKPMIIKREWAMPNKETFSILPIRNLIERYCCNKKIIVDPFARNSKIATITNDLDSSFNTNYNMEALDFLKMLPDNHADCILFDPPYSPRQVSECYKKSKLSVNMQTTQASFWGNIKKEVSRILKIEGCCITFGWNSGGIGKSNGFYIIEILLVAHGGWHNDTICTVEIKRNNT